MKRICFIVLALAVIVSLLCVPAFGATNLIDYNDYVTDIKVDGDNDLVTVTLPGSMSMIEVVRGDTWEYVLRTPQSATFNPIPNLSYYINLQMLHSNRFDLSLFPDDTKIEYNYSISTSGNSIIDIGYRYIFTQYFHGDDFISQTFVEPDIGTTYSAVATIIKPTGADSFSGYLSFEDIRFSFTAPVTVSLDSVKLTFSISSLYRQQQLTGKTNKLLDDIANYHPIVETPNGGEIIGDIGSVEDELMDDVQGGIGEIENSTSSAIGTLSRYATALFCVSWIMNQLFTISWVTDLLYVSMGLGVLIILFNISLTAIGNRGKKSGKSKGG